MPQPRLFLGCTCSGVAVRWGVNANAQTDQPFMRGEVVHSQSGRKRPISIDSFGADGSALSVDSEIHY